MSVAARAESESRLRDPARQVGRSPSVQRGTPQASCLYVGTIRHRRAQPRSQFGHAIALAYLDLDELPRLLGGRLTRPGPGLLRFRRDDYLGGGPGAAPLADAVRARVRALGATPPTGPIRLLTQLRSFGLCFNPVSFYYCFDAGDDGHPQCVLAEVTNTPWGERHSYLLAQDTGAPVLHGQVAKALHVSPLLGMDHVYRARATAPGATLSVHIEARRAGQTAFDATLKLHRRPLDPRGAGWLTARHPAATARVLALIYGHALALRLRGASWYPHPARAA